MREVLEATLRSQWTRENLAVYGDFLQSQDGARDRQVFPPFRHPTARIESMSWRERGDEQGRAIVISCGRAPHRLDLARTRRMLELGALSDEARLAWLDLIIVFEELFRGEPGRPFPARTLARAVGAIDVTQEHAKDWAPLHAELAGYPGDEITLACE